MDVGDEGEAEVDDSVHAFSGHKGNRHVYTPGVLKNMGQKDILEFRNSSTTWSKV